jgi:hypothetical protein
MDILAQIVIIIILTGVGSTISSFWLVLHPVLFERSENKFQIYLTPLYMQLNFEFLANFNKNTCKYFSVLVSNCSDLSPYIHDPADRLWIALCLKEGYLMIKLSELKEITCNAEQYNRYSDYYLKRLLPLAHAINLKYRPISIYRLQPRGSNPDILVRFD